MNALPQVPVYLLYGNRVDAIQGVRDRLLEDLLDPEARNENLTEFSSSGNRFGVELEKLLPEIAGDLDTMSFIPGAKKVVVVTNPVEVYGSGGRARRKSPAKKSARGKTAAKKATAKSSEPAYMEWMRTALPETGNHLILLCYEDEADGREVNEKHPLVQLIARVGHCQAFRDTKAFFRIESALIERNSAACLVAVRDLWKTGKGDMAVYSSIIRCLRFMLQAAIGRERRVGGDSAKRALYFPARAQFSLYKSSDWMQRKYTSRPAAYGVVALLACYERMLEVYEALRPRPDALFVPDARRLLEQVLMELFASPRSR